MMKLVNISKSEETYIVKAMHSVNLFGLEITSKVKSYTLSKDHQYWYETGTNKKVSKKQRLKLNKWLKDHQKFIEKRDF